MSLTNTTNNDMQAPLAKLYIGLTFISLLIMSFNGQHLIFLRYPIYEICIATLGIGFAAMLWLIQRQHGQYLVSPLRQIMSQRALSLDEREVTMRQKVFERSYTYSALLGMFGVLYFAFIAQSMHNPVMHVRNVALWILLSVIVLFISLPSVIAALQDSK